MKRMLLSFAALLILSGSASATDRTEFNKMKYGRAYLSVREEKADKPRRKPRNTNMSPSKLTPVLTAAAECGYARRAARLHGRPFQADYFSTRKWLVTENTPGTEFARNPAMFLSPSLATTPSSVNCPFLTIR